ncbi:P-loop NTPase fold protein [Halomonas sp. BL6]|uniref:KAP family P-loop NTPase fold protein n=1 Tax=Halomonas sp. BL6 TaxID=2585770 RepID=UPI00159BACC5|nr:P-loop NTPase fold protein [Halomonas sp. BL6]
MSAWDRDLLGRREVADFLQNLLESDKDITVINIDSPWGTGKTFFLENWKQQLEEDRGVVYFNAWKKDYTGDPFVSLVAAINDQLASQRGLSPELESLEGFVEKASKAIAATTPILMKFAAKGLLKRFTGFDADGAGEALQGVSDDVAEAAIQSLIENSAHEQQIVEDFSDALQNLVVEVSKHKSNDNLAPVYILIDELDRCRPTYAIELLERVKHFFSVRGCKFVIATDTGQLQHSIRSVYGEGFNSLEYLKRFFDLDYTLDNSDLVNWLKVNYLSGEKGDNVYCLDLVEDHTDELYQIISDKKTVRPDVDTVLSSELDRRQIIILALARTFQCSLRNLERNCRHIDASLVNIKERRVHFFYLAYLVFLRNSDIESYKSFINDGLSLRAKEVLSERFKPKRIYFRHCSEGVHEIAKNYFDAKRSGLSNSQVKQSPNYKNRIRSDLQREDVTLDYDKVISLASKIG